jgi:hypothetical protein
MINILNDLHLTSSHGWIKYDKSWENIDYRTIQTFIYRLKCSIKPIYRHVGNIVEIVKLDDKYLITQLQLTADREGRLKYVNLFKQLHPNKDPKNNLFCLGKLKGVQVGHSLVSLLMACLLKYKDNDCFNPPINVKKIGEVNECQTS